MRNGGLEEAQAGINARRNISNLRYEDDTTLMAESEEELKSLLMKVKEESEKVGLKLNLRHKTTQHWQPNLGCFPSPPSLSQEAQKHHHHRYHKKVRFMFTWAGDQREAGGGLSRKLWNALSWGQGADIGPPELCRLHGAQPHTRGWKGALSQALN